MAAEIVYIGYRRIMGTVEIQGKSINIITDSFSHEV